MILEESASNYIQNEAEEKVSSENGYPNENSIPQEKPENWLWKMLKSPTGEGSIQSYSNHPLNTKNNDYVGQIIRGLTGMMGQLNFAILDILLGSFGLIKEKKDVTNYTTEDTQEYNSNTHGNIQTEPRPSIINGQYV